MAVISAGISTVRPSESVNSRVSPVWAALALSGVAAVSAKARGATAKPHAKAAEHRATTNVRRLAFFTIRIPFSQTDGPKGPQKNRRRPKAQVGRAMRCQRAGMSSISCVGTHTRTRSS